MEPKYITPFATTGEDDSMPALPTVVFHFTCRFPTLPTPSTVSYGFQRCILSLWNSVQSAGEGLEVCACADVLAAASISHSGAIARIKLTILKEAVCFLLVTQSGNFIAQPPEISAL